MTVEEEIPSKNTDQIDNQDALPDPPAKRKATSKKSGGKVSAKALELAQENSIDLASIKGTGKNGSITVGDVRKAMNASDDAPSTPGNTDASTDNIISQETVAAGAPSPVQIDPRAFSFDVNTGSAAPLEGVPPDVSPNNSNVMFEESAATPAVEDGGSFTTADMPPPRQNQGPMFTSPMQSMGPQPTIPGTDISPSEMRGFFQT